MKRIVKIFTLITVIGILPVLLFAPPGGSWNPGGTDPTVPLGGGLVFMTIAGLLYATRTFIKNRKK